MAKTIQLGKLRMDDLANALGFIVPIAAKAGISFEEISAGIAVMTKQGINANMASRQLRQVISSLIAPSEQAMTAMQDMGLVYDDLTLESEGLRSTLLNINNATEGQIGLTTQLIQNVRALTGVLALNTGEGEMYIDAMGEIVDSGGTLNEMYQKIADSSDMMRRKQEMLTEEIDRGVGEALEPAGRAWTDFWTQMRIGRTEMNKIRDAAQELVDAAMETESIEIYAGMLDKVNTEFMKQINIVSKLIGRQEEYRQELTDLKAQKDILTATHNYKEALHFIPLALKDAAYTTKIFDTSTQALVDSIRMQRGEIDKLSKANEEYAMVVQQNSLEAMKIQLKAMGRRGRMTRSEKKRMDELKKSDLEYRIASTENQVAINKIKQSGLTAEEEKLEGIKTAYAEEVRIINDSYNRQLASLNTHIVYKTALILKYNQLIIDANTAAKDEYDTYYKYLDEIDATWTDEAKARLAEITGETILENRKRLDDTIETQKKIIQTWKAKAISEINPIVSAVLSQSKNPIARRMEEFLRTRRMPRFQYGGIVKDTGIAMVHEGERVVPRHRARQERTAGTPSNLNVNIKIDADLYDHTDIESLGAKIGMAVAAEIRDNYEVG